MAEDRQKRPAGAQERGVLSSLPHRRPGQTRTARQRAGKSTDRVERQPTAPKGRATARRQTSTAKATRAGRAQVKRPLPRQGFEVEGVEEVEPPLGGELLGWLIDQLAGGGNGLLQALEGRGGELLRRLASALGRQ